MLVEKLNIKINVEEIREYYNILTNGHKTHYWDAREHLDDVANGAREGFKNHNGKDIDVAGWAIQRWDNEAEVMAPHPNILKGFNVNVYEQKIEDVQGKTPMLFGIAKRIIELFPDSSRMALSVINPSTHLKRHNDENFLWRVHIPVFSEPGSIWSTEEGDVHMEVGHAYLCDTRNFHSVTNDSKSVRVHLLFALPESSLETLRNLTEL